MIKKLLVLCIFLLAINESFASSCVYRPGSSVFRCNNNKPGISIMPGELSNLTITCCYTADGLEGQNFTISASIVNNFTYVTSGNQSGELVNVVINYPASQFIKGVYFDDSVTAFEDFTVTVEYDLPLEHELYEPGAVLNSRVDIRLFIPGSYRPNNAVTPQIIIPQDWVKEDYSALIISLTSLPAVIFAGYLLRRKLKSSKLSKSLKTETPIKKSLKGKKAKKIKA